MFGKLPIPLQTIFQTFINFDFVRVAILDMYNDKPDQQGIRCIQDILKTVEADAQVTIFNVRAKFEVPDLGFDLYISSGGPGNPLEYNINWSEKYYRLIDDIFEWNMTHTDHPKYFFAICHSFQILCAYKGIGSINKRERFTFGVTTIKKTNAGKADVSIKNLNDTFFAADHRYFQVVNPDLAKMEKSGAKILGLEERSGEDSYERSIMMVRFSPEIIGTQFHPEADVFGMEQILENKSLQEEIERILGAGKVQQIQKDLENPETVLKMYNTLLPDFINNCKQSIASILENEVVN